ncbi:hypothetical protein [Streptomyces sp. NBC_00670]|uniref:hypothetical protein n=1 Tax=Streptomyces sp. NBC_00670 TaxID=2975804 RepID=UPI002E36193C|nr:hypothetical protein [Streptomyces sp. NBC_00670]
MDFLALAADRIDEDLERERKAETYAAQPGEWARDKLGEHLWSKQLEIAESVRTNRFTAVHSCHGSGKSFSASRLVCWWLDTHPPGQARVVTTAPTGDQVKAILWSEINGAWVKAEQRGELFIGRVNETDWKYGKQLIAFGRKPSDYNPHAFQGIHAKFVLVILDEACGVNKQFWTAAMSIATGEHCRILAIGNPDDPGSHFARVCQPGSRWNTIHISTFDTPNFTGEPVPDELRPSLVSQAYVDDMRDEFGETSPTYISKVLGEFPDEAEDGVVRLSALRACHAEREETRPAAEQVPHELGIDMGGGGDETVVWERRGMVVGRRWGFREKDPVKATARLLEIIQQVKPTAVKIDSIGIGWGIAGNLREKGLRGEHQAVIVPVNVSEKSSEPEKFPRLRSEIWWRVARQLSEDRSWDLSELEEKHREQLVTQLTAPKYSIDAAGRTVVEPKDETKKRLGRSPDDADALILAFYTPPGGAEQSMDWLREYAAA